jgi:hypothetical protein
MKINYYIKIIIVGIIISAMITPSISGVNASTVILDADFEVWNGSLPDGFTVNTGWLDSLYGFPHGGSHWAYSWAAGDKLTTITLTFHSDTELSFFYSAESATTPMDLEVYLDDTILIWSSYGFIHTTYYQVVVDLSSYSGDHTISFLGLTSSSTYGQMLDDVKVITTMNQPPIADANGPYYADIDETIQLDGTGSYDLDGTIDTYEWDLDDDGQYDDATGSTPTNTWNNEGTYDISLKVTDNDRYSYSSYN